MKLPAQLALAALAAVAGCGRPPDRPASAPEPRAAPDRAPAPQPGAPTEAELFVDVAAQAGLDFVHFNGMSGKFYICEVKCPGVGWADLDNDGDLDAYFPQGCMLGKDASYADALFPFEGELPPRHRLYRNDLAVAPDGSATIRFTEITDAAGIDITDYGVGVAAGDYDNDGWIDLYITCFGPNHLLHNNGDGTFTDATESSGTQDARYNTGAAFLDYDRDGWLDLFVGAYVNFSFGTHHECFARSGERDYCGPLSYEPLPDRLYRNRGDGSFEDVSARAHIVQEYGSALGVIGADFNRDGWCDIYVANDGRENQLWINQQDGTFVNTALLAGCAVDSAGVAQASMGVDVGDFDGDGDDDLFMTHLATENNALYVNDGAGMFEERSFVAGLGRPSIPYTSFGTAWIDYDNDTWLDLFIANGAVRAEEALVAAGVPFPYGQRNQLFRNLGTGQFEEITDRAGALTDLVEISRGVAFGDVDNDGDTDMLVTNVNARPRLFVNRVGSRQPWFGLRLVDRSGRRDMPGTRIAVRRADGSALWRRVRADGSYCAANDPRVLVGLGSGPAVTEVEVFWPDGQVERWQGPPLRRYTTLRQGTGTPAGS